MEKLLIERIKDLHKDISNNIRSYTRKPDKLKNITQVQIFFFLVNNQGSKVNQKDICKEFNLKKSSVSENLDYFERENIIERVPDENDKRKNNIVLSNKALDKINEINNGLEVINDRLISNISEKELKIFIKVLDKMQENMRG